MHGVHALGPPLDPGQRHIMADHRDAVGGRSHVEFEAITAGNGQRGEEGRDRVLRGNAPVAAMSEPQGPNATHVLAGWSEDPSSRCAESPKWSLG